MSLVDATQDKERGAEKIICQWFVVTLESRSSSIVRFAFSISICLPVLIISLSIRAES